MKKIAFITILFFAMVNVVWANHTRMATFMAGDYIDDLVNIALYPHHIVSYENNLYGDIANQLDDYGIIIAPEKKFGALACWQNMAPAYDFNIGYGIKLFNFDIGVSGSPVEDHFKMGFGLGRTFFSRRFDLSLLFSDGVNDEWLKFNLRCSRRRGDFIIVPKYTLDYVSEPNEFNRHRIGLMLQRLILNEGFVYFIAEYDFTQGDVESDYTNIYAGLELPLGRRIGLRLGAQETFSNGFESPKWQVEPGISIRIREFSIDFHLNKESLFDKETTLFKSFGLDLNFSRF
jgi:hypothetical protein